MGFFKLKNKSFLFVWILLVIVVTGWFLLKTITFGSYLAPATRSLPVDSRPMVQIGSVSIPVELATTSAAIKKGLSGRPALDPNLGLLFIFPQPAIYQFWMPEMHFPIDIIWIDEGRVVDIDERVSPEFNPAQPIFYRPKQSVTRVLEVNAGWFTSHRLRIGDSVMFKNIK